MDTKGYLRLAGAIFALVALAHLVRAVLNWPIVIAGWIVPIWLSWVAFLVAAVLSWFGWNLSKRV
ncbi:MAG TPA: hypothetical protein VMU31_00730 [Rhizomicrobium sp.]|nr:hypothetical protein [Rhizomicrobium sp.]